MALIDTASEKRNGGRVGDAKGPLSMSLERLIESIDFGDTGRRMHKFIADLYPICRSIPGDGFRETLRQVRGQVPLAIREVPTGTKVFDWTIPREWNIRDAWINGPNQERIIDFRKSNLHVVN